jgi:hypothetical protein
VKTLFLGSYGFGNLGDELCLLEAMKSFPSDEVIAFSVNPEYTRLCTGVSRFIRYRAEIADLQVERIVLGGGGVGFFPSIRDSLHWMRDGWERGAKCHIHNIGVAHMPELGSCSVRDHISWHLMKSWPVKLNPQITFYPEKKLPADDTLKSLFSGHGPVLGISIIGTRAMRHAMDANAKKIEEYLHRFSGWQIAPIVSTVHGFDEQEDDIAGFEYFRSRFLRNFQVVGEELLDREWLRHNITPLKLKGLIGSLDRLLSQRKHNCIHAIGSGVPFTGIFPGDDDSILRIFYSLRDEISMGSDFISLTVK